MTSLALEIVRHYQSLLCKNLEDFNALSSPQHALLAQLSHQLNCADRLPSKSAINNALSSLKKTMTSNAHEEISTGASGELGKGEWHILGLASIAMLGHVLVHLIAANEHITKQQQFWHSIKTSKLSAFHHAISSNLQLAKCYFSGANKINQNPICWNDMAN